MFGKRNRFGSEIVVVVVASLGMSAGIADAASPPPAGWQKAPAARAASLDRTVAGTTAPDWLRALTLRSDALNSKYKLGDYALSKASATTPDWLRALMLRSDALNRQHRLGEYALSKASTTMPDWLRALMLRSDALNRQYRLGEYEAALGVRARADARRVWCRFE